jgi:hypothetical protein
VAPIITTASLALRPFFWRSISAAPQSWLALTNPEHRIPLAADALPGDLYDSPRPPTRRPAQAAEHSQGSDSLADRRPQTEMKIWHQIDGKNCFLLL